MEPASAGNLEDFFVSGGTVPLESRSYIERSADTALFEALSAGKFCYVLNSRQMGKSSLCVRTMARLEAGGTRTAFVDLTKIGGRNVTPDQWYAGLVVEVGRALGMRAEMLRNWQEQRELSPMQRFFSALRDVALEKIAAPIVVFVDEIDASRSLPFSANEFFAGIRECYNRRVHDPAYKRLTFCLLGVAVPGDLIADPTTTPFNIGERVVLTDFTEREAAPLTAGLSSDEVLRRILYWTNGHPFLTQSLASTAQSNGNVHSATDVDRLVADLLFQAKARETNINLADVGNRILSGSPDPKQVARYRADVLSLYENVLKGREVFDDESNRLAAVLKLSGIVRVEDRRLKLRNRIYERVFDRTWIRENMPGAELRRQRRAFLKGAVRTALVAAVVLAVIAFLAIRAVHERDRANYEVYVADMNLMPSIWAQNNIERIETLLDATRENPARGWEWEYWYRMSHLASDTLPKQNFNIANFARNGKIYGRNDGHIWEYSPDTRKWLDLMPMLGQAEGFILPFPDGRRLLEADAIHTAQVIDIANRTRLTKLEDFSVFMSYGMISPDGRWVIGGRQSEWSRGENASFLSAVIWDTETGKSTSIPTARSNLAAFSPEGRSIAVGEVDTSHGASSFRAVVREYGTWKIQAAFETAGPTSALCFSPRGDQLATGTANGWVQLWDLKTRRETARTQAAGGTIDFLQYSSDGAWLATSSIERLARLYDVNGKEPRLLSTYRDAQPLTISPDKTRVMGQYDEIRLYDPRSSAETPTASAVVTYTDLSRVLSRKTPALVLSAGKVYELDPLSGASRALTWIPGRTLLLPESGESWGLAERADGVLEILYFDGRRLVATLPKAAVLPTVMSAFPDGRRVALFFPNGSAEVRDAIEGRVLQRLELPAFPFAANVSPDGRALAAGLIDGEILVWDTQTWRPRKFRPGGGDIMSLSFSPNGARLLASTTDDRAEVWDMASGQLVGMLLGHAQTVNDAAYSPDGRRIVTASFDGTVRVWDAATIRELTTLEGHKSAVWRARFTDDGSSILSVDDQGTAKMWLTKTPAKAGSAK